MLDPGYAVVPVYASHGEPVVPTLAHICQPKEQRRCATVLVSTGGTAALGVVPIIKDPDKPIGFIVAEACA